jgi:hypothetical protein
LAIAGIAGEAAAADAPRNHFVILEGPSVIEALPAGVGVASPAGRRVIAQRSSELAQSHAALRPKLEAAGAQISVELRKVLLAFEALVTSQYYEGVPLEREETT